MPENINQTDDLNNSDLAARTQAQAKAELPQPNTPKPWENQEQPTLPEDHPFFGLRVRQLLNSAEDTVNKKVIAPFRQGLDNMGDDLQNAATTGHTQSGGQLSEPTRALAGGVGTLLKFAPVGSNVRDTALMSLTPTLPEGHLFEGLRVIPSTPMAEAEANALRQATGKSLESEEELITARKQKAEFDANKALAARKVDTDPKASVPSKNKNVSELKTSSVSEQKVDRGTEPSTAMSEEEKADLRKSSGKPLKTEADYIAARKTQAEWESNKALSAGKVDTDPKANVGSKNKNQQNKFVDPEGQPKTITVHRGGVPGKPGKFGSTFYAEDPNYAGKFATDDGTKLSSKQISPKKPLDLNKPEDALTAAKAIVKAEGSKESPEEFAKSIVKEGGVSHLHPKAAEDLSGQGYDYLTSAHDYGSAGTSGRVWLELPAKNSPKQVVESAGLIHKGELVPGSGVHMFEHPDHPGKTAALQEPLTPEAVKAKMDSKLDEFGVGKKGKPEYAYRVRSVGEDGIPADPRSHAHATMSEAEAHGYLEDRSHATGKPQEVIRFKLNELDPDHFSRKTGPRGSDWIRLNKPVTEKAVEKVPHRKVDLLDPKTQAVMSLGKR